jgi:DnaJ family protein C protein 2
LFDYSEDQLFADHPELTHYEILNCPEFATQDEIKKAYRKASLKYHPDKTGRDSEDYVFLAVKAAHDTLFDTLKRQAYDSTTMPFDDGIPAERSKLLEDKALKYQDDHFYDTFGPVFLRNLRFDSRLRPDVVNKKKKNSNKKGGNGGKPQKAPKLGDADSAESVDMKQVHAFYEYWIHFESWRDFSAQAADELQVENELENAESRFEKRWIQKEIDKRCKQLKRAEMARIQLLVTRAMEADPRIRKERQELIEAKEKQKKDLEMAAKKEVQDAIEAAAAEVIRAAEEKIRLAEEKVERDKNKKQLRKARQLLRRVSLESFDNAEQKLWDDSYDMNQDIDALCASLTLIELKALGVKVEETICNEESLLIIQRHVQRAKDTDPADANSAPEAAPAAMNGHANNGSAKSAPTAKTPWTKDELSALAKAVKKYPPGGSSRWEQIALLLNNLCKQDEQRSKEECIDKYNHIARNAKPLDSNTLNGGHGGHAENGNATLASASTTSTTTATTEDAEDDADAWSAEADQLLQDGLTKYPASMEKNERWDLIAKCVPGRSKKDCVTRFKAIREALKNRK